MELLLKNLQLQPFLLDLYGVTCVIVLKYLGIQERLIINLVLILIVVELPSLKNQLLQHFMDKINGGLVAIAVLLDGIVAINP